MPERVLIAEPDIETALRAEECLRQAGYGVSLVRDGAAALNETRRQRPDVVLTELDLPGVTGLDLCRSLRTDASCESILILVVTRRADSASRIAAFEAGADDLIVSPFSPRELALRVRALLRRVERNAPRPPAILRVGALEIDVARHRVCVDGDDVYVTPVEFRLLLFLATEPGHVHSRGDLLEQVWGLDRETETRTVDTHVKRLREKLGAARDYVETLPRVGYRMREM